MKAMLEEQIREIPYGIVLRGTFIIKSNKPNRKISNGTTVALASLSKNGLKTLKSDVGEVIKSNDSIVIIKFNKSFGYDNELYVLLAEQPDFKSPKNLILIYKEE